MARFLIGFIFCACVWSVFAEPFTVRIHLRDYRPEGLETVALADGIDAALRLPVSFGLHFRAGEACGYPRALFHVHAATEGTVTLRFNRLFEGVGRAESGLAEGADGTGGNRKVHAGWNWVEFPIHGRREMRFELTGAPGLACDLAVLTKSKTFDPSNLDATALAREAARRAPRDEFSDRLFERAPLMPLTDYVAAVAAHLGANPRRPVALTDENGALLHAGRPTRTIPVTTRAAT